MKDCIKPYTPVFIFMNNISIRFTNSVKRNKPLTAVFASSVVSHIQLCIYSMHSAGRTHLGTQAPNQDGPPYNAPSPQVPASVLTLSEINILNDMWKMYSLNRELSEAIKNVTCGISMQHTFSGSEGIVAQFPHVHLYKEVNKWINVYCMIYVAYRCFCVTNYTFHSC